MKSGPRMGTTRAGTALPQPNGHVQQHTSRAFCQLYVWIAGVTSPRVDEKAPDMVRCPVAESKQEGRGGPMTRWGRSVTRILVTVPTVLLGTVLLATVTPAFAADTLQVKVDPIQGPFGTQFTVTVTENPD